MKTISLLTIFFLFTAMLFAQKSSQNPDPHDCSKLPAYNKLKAELAKVVKEGKGANGGLGNQEWATVVNRDGIVCAVTFSGPNRAAQWPGSRMISAMKANTANAFSTNDFALSSGNIYSAAQPGQSLYSIISPANPQAVFSGNPQDFGQQNDPMVGKPVGGVIVFGGGLPLYSGKGELVGGLGVSGDSSCADHVVAWKTRHGLGLDAVPMGVAPGPSDNLIFDIQNGVSSSGFGHPACKGGKPNEDIIQKLTQTVPIGPKH